MSKVFWLVGSVPIVWMESGGGKPPGLDVARGPDVGGDWPPEVPGPGGMLGTPDITGVDT